MMTGGVKTVTSELPGSPVPHAAAISGGLRAHAGDLKRLGEESFSNLPHQASGATPGGFARATPPRKGKTVQKTKKTMSGHKWKRLRTGAFCATSTGSGATDEGPAWGCLTHLRERSSTAHESTRPGKIKVEIRPVTNTLPYLVGRTVPDWRPRDGRRPLRPIGWSLSY